MLPPVLSARSSSLVGNAMRTLADARRPRSRRRHARFRSTLCRVAAHPAARAAPRSGRALRRRVPAPAGSKSERRWDAALGPPARSCARVVYDGATGSPEEQAVMHRGTPEQCGAAAGTRWLPLRSHGLPLTTPPRLLPPSPTPSPRLRPSWRRGARFVRADTVFTHGAPLKPAIRLARREHKVYS